MSIDWDHPQPFVITESVLPEHIDALAHTNNAQYVNWCMAAAWAHTTALGLGADSYQRLDRAMALTRAEYDYLKATHVGDALLVGTWITNWDRRLTMNREVQMIESASGTTVLRARLQFVCIEISSGKPRRPPAEFVAGYGPALLNP